MPRREPPPQNALLRALAAASRPHYDELNGSLEAVRVEPRTALVAAGAVPGAVYFVEAGFLSLVGQTASGESIEIGFVGPEGVTSIGWLLGGGVPYYSLVAELPVAAYRLDARVIRRLLAGSHPLHCLFLLFGQFFLGQVAQNAVCARFHSAVQRVARWMLLAAHRLATPVIPITHEVMASVIGAPRSVVTDAIGLLRDAACVDSRRGSLVITDAKQMSGFACECYAIERRRLRSFERRLTAIGEQPESSRDAE